MIRGGERIVVTGVGVVASGARSSRELFEQVMRGPIGVEVLEIDRGERVACFAVKEELVRGEMLGKIRREGKADRMVKLGLLAAERAWLDAGLVSGGYLPDRIAVCAGTGRGPMERIWQLSEKVREGGKVRPGFAAETSVASLHGAVAGVVGARGVGLTLANACASGGCAIALGASLLAAGEADVVLAGGSDAGLHPFLVRQMLAAGILDRRLPPAPVCCPYSAEADGTILGEGAAFLVLEREEGAKRRGAGVRGWLAGWGIASEGSCEHVEAGGGRALRIATRVALERGGIEFNEVGYVNTHGTGTRVNDDVEVEFLWEFLGSGNKKAKWSSTKPVTGHCLGATGALEAAVCIESLRAGVAPVNWNCEKKRDDLPEGLVLKSGERIPGRYTISLSYGFWGSGVCLVFGRVEN
ncbi:MAG: beta-ketoacyl-[acyl-carrier-protein] synthase family protein [Chthoniobacterales bacterium]|nr:beta-ketoacyl-[acyl-carrier-protein] synthase family protein [Chthoniobacterales bacterium]